MSTLAEQSQLLVIDPVPLLCKTDICSQSDGKEWMYRGGDHLTPCGANKLEATLNDDLTGALDR